MHPKSSALQATWSYSVRTQSSCARVSMDCTRVDYNEHAEGRPVSLSHFFDKIFQPLFQFRWNLPRGRCAAGASERDGLAIARDKLLTRRTIAQMFGQLVTGLAVEVALHVVKEKPVHRDAFADAEQAFQIIEKGICHWRSLR